MKPVFADTFFFIALISARDAAHSKVAAVASSQTRPLVTTSFVLTEVADGLAATPDRPLFEQLLSDMRSDQGSTVVPATQELFERGVQLYMARPDKEWSLTDCISFVVMKDRGISDALTADHHFEQAGFVALLK
jgi:predicted nucleic acid-binding protein